MKRQTIKITTPLRWHRLSVDREQVRYDNLRFLADNFAEQLDAIDEICVDAGIDDAVTRVEAVQKLANRAPQTARTPAKAIPEGPQDRSGIELGDQLDWNSAWDRRQAAQWYRQFEGAR